MTPDQTDWVIALASTSAVCEFWGTGTVWAAYRRSARLGNTIRREIEGVRAESEGPTRKKRLSDMINLAAKYRDPFELQKEQLANLDQLETLASPLAKSFWMTSGLVAYFVGAILGLLAVIVGVA